MADNFEIQPFRGDGSDNDADPSEARIEIYNRLLADITAQLGAEKSEGLLSKTEIEDAIQKAQLDRYNKLFSDLQASSATERDRNISCNEGMVVLPRQKIRASIQMTARKKDDTPEKTDLETSVKDAKINLLKKVKAQLEADRMDGPVDKEDFQDAIEEAKLDLSNTLLEQIQAQIMAERKKDRPKKADLETALKEAQNEDDRINSEITSAKGQAGKRKQEIEDWKNWYHNLPEVDKTPELKKVTVEINWRLKEVAELESQIISLELDKMTAMGRSENTRHNLRALDEGVYDRPVEEDRRLKGVKQERDRVKSERDSVAARRDKRRRGRK